MERWTLRRGPAAGDASPRRRVRDLMGTALALEHPSAELARAHRRAARRAGTARGARAGRPPARASATMPDPGRRVYLDHSRDVGDYNACFPVYELGGARRPRRGAGQVPVVYEGPPGVVHGGFLAVFFDCVLQQLNCDMGGAGKTRALSLRYRRPVPDPHRARTRGRRAPSTESSHPLHGRAAPRRHGDVRAEMSAVLGDRDALPGVSRDGERRVTDRRRGPAQPGREPRRRGLRRLRGRRGSRTPTRRSVHG